MARAAEPAMQCIDYSGWDDVGYHQLGPDTRVGSRRREARRDNNTVLWLWVYQVQHPSLVCHIWDATSQGSFHATFAKDNCGPNRRECDQWQKIYATSTAQKLLISDGLQPKQFWVFAQCCFIIYKATGSAHYFRQRIKTYLGDNFNPQKKLLHVSKIYQDNFK